MSNMVVTLFVHEFMNGFIMCIGDEEGMYMGPQMLSVSNWRDNSQITDKNIGRIVFENIIKI